MLSPACATGPYTMRPWKFSDIAYSLKKRQGPAKPSPGVQIIRRSITTGAAAEPTATGTTSAARTGTILRLIDLQWATAHIGTVEVLDRAGRIGLAHLDKATPARPTCFPIDRERDRLDGAMLREQRANFRIRGGK